MTYAALALGLLGVVAGIASRLRVLLLILVLLLICSVVFSLAHGFGFLEAALVAMAVQIIVQSSYFGGLWIRAASTAFLRERSVL